MRISAEILAWHKLEREVVVGSSRVKVELGNSRHDSIARLLSWPLQVGLRAAIAVPGTDCRYRQPRDGVDVPSMQPSGNRVQVTWTKVVSSVGGCVQLSL
jgi:hypothetical protein